MPKQLEINPDETYAVDRVRFSDIPVHAYNQNSDQERARRGDERLREALRHMLVISTTKAALEIESPVDGTLSEIRIGEGELTEVGAVLGIIE